MPDFYFLPKWGDIRAETDLFIDVSEPDSTLIRSEISNQDNQEIAFHFCQTFDQIPFQFLASSRKIDPTVEYLPENFSWRDSGDSEFFEYISCVDLDTGNLSTSTISDYYNPPTNIASSGDVVLYGSFSAGEVVIAFLILCLIVITLVKSLASSLSNIKTKKTFLSYGGGDVEIRDDL
jgi:hypothetical protein